jgi:hypothetical protein
MSPLVGLEWQLVSVGGGQQVYLKESFQVERVQETWEVSETWTVSGFWALERS